MKKLLALSLLIFGLGYMAQAQVSPHAIGLRFGGNGTINGAEISYQQGLGDNNRLELDFGFGVNKTWNRFYFAGMYHWAWTIDGGLNWFVGPGASLGFYTYDGNSGYINVALGGQLGLEYNFNHIGAPILLSLDIRPMWDFLGDHAGLGWGAALGVRYTF
jgi:hypothetical protein